jgi:FkbM family methyltransferase
MNSARKLSGNDPMPMPPVIRDEEFRVRMTVSCRDADTIPKVQNAGQVIQTGGEAVQVMHNGLQVVAGGYYGKWMSRVIQELKGHHEPQEELIFHHLMKIMSPSATMIELGGFWSYYSLWFLNNAPARRAVVIEPDPNYLAVGARNAQINAATNVRFVQASAGDVCLSPRPFQTESAGPQTVPEMTVAQIMAENGLASLDFLHCDIQGHETKVLQSCEQLLREKKIAFCMISTHTHHISSDPLTHQRCLSMILEFGGRILAEHDVHESFSGDGLIAAYFGDDYLKWEEPAISRNRYSTSLFRNPLYDLAEHLGIPSHSISLA